MYNNVMPLLIQPSSWPQALLAVVTCGPSRITVIRPGCPVRHWNEGQMKSLSRAREQNTCEVSLSLSYFLTCTHTFTHRGMESGPSCESENHPRDLIHPCFCVSGQPHRSCLHFSNITGFSTAQRPGSPTGPLGASAPVFSRAHDEIYV